ncbi:MULTISPECIES: hypothetical protein [unclassified Paenibacillus]|uniref:hypothetical protein n=1 Tax=unclassified Paenibacillus TaxID=185978 RepID=UPI00363BD03E
MLDFEKFPKVLESDYLKFNINETIPIYQGEFTLNVNDAEYFNFIGELSLEWLPNPNIKFFGEPILKKDANFHKLFNNSEKNKIKLKIPNHIEDEVFISEFSIITGSIAGNVFNIIEQQSTKVSYINCGIVNFLNTYGDIVKYKQSGIRSRNKININEWDIIIDKRPDYSEKKINEKLKNTGGYAITHLCQIKRLDGEMFDTKDIASLEKALYWTLSFASGRHVGICLLEGYFDNKIVWKRYETPIIDEWKYRKTWFPINDGQSLQRILPQIYSKLQDEYWSNVLTHTLSWYLECQSDGIIEHKIVSSQVALETLAWSYLVEDRKILKEHEYKDMRASDIFRLFFKQFCEESSIPIDFPYLDDIKRLNYSESAHLLTDYRNNIVHPKKKRKFNSLQSDFSFYVLRLGLHFLELSLLFILKYEGKYVDQLYFGWDKTYDFVPWNGNKSQA